MIKRRFALLFSVCLAAVFLFSACSSKEAEPEAEEGRMDFEDWEEQGGEETEEITDHVATFRIENYSGYEITYGLSFDLEVEKGDDWVPLNRKEEVTFEDVSYVLKDRSEVEIECDLAPYGELQDGNYRMLKDDVYVEFTIKDGKLAQS